MEAKKEEGANDNSPQEMGSIVVEALIEEEAWYSLSDAPAIFVSDMLKKSLLFMGVDSIHVSVKLTSDQELQNLNKEFRGKNAPTNVLSFPYGRDLIQERGELRSLGDIVLSYQRILEESMEQNKNFEHHCTHMLVHGLLHLLGCDHEEEEDIKEMEKMEVKILKSFDIKNPYL